MRQCHYDNVGSNYDNEKVLKINQAFEVLNDLDKKMQYDTEMGFIKRYCLRNFYLNKVK